MQQIPEYKHEVQELYFSTYFSLDGKERVRWRIAVLRDGKEVWRSSLYKTKAGAERYAPVYAERFRQYLKRTGKRWEDRFARDEVAA